MPAPLTQQEVIKRFREVHGGKYDYSRVNYKNTHTNVEIICQKHGTFHQTPSSHINRKSDCPRCGRALAGQKRKIDFDDFVHRCRKVHGNNFEYDGTDYSTYQKPITIRCIKHNEIFKQRPSTHVKGSIGCHKCLKEKLTGGRLLPSDWLSRFRDKHGTKYSYPPLPKKIKGKDGITISCPKHGMFSQRVQNHARGDGCPECSHNVPLKLEDIKKLGEARNIQLVSNQYKNSKESLVWKCEHGHVWKQSIDKSRKSGIYCRECLGGRYFGEEIVRGFFEKVFGQAFPNLFPPWLDGLQLDGYCDSLGIAFEHQGLQHYTENKGFHKGKNNFAKQKRHDIKKKNLCEKNNVELLCIPSVPDLTSIEELQVLIDEWCEANQIIQVRSARSVKVHTIGLKVLQKERKRLAEIARRKGGKLISKTFCGAETKLEWRCSKGHTWWAIPVSVAPTAESKQGTWCPICAGNTALEIKDAQQLAEKHGGRCLSEKIVNAREKLTWECQHGHRWEATLTSVRNNSSWCPRCSGRSNIEECRRVAEENGGRLVTKTYKNQTALLSWECGKCNKKFRKSLKKVKRGEWCPVCNPPRDIVSEAKKVIREKAGLYLGATKSKSSGKKRIRVECAEGHKWSVDAFSIVNGNWCPVCAGTQTKTIKEIHELARRRGGMCLSKSYKNMHTKLRWRCKKGHEWDQTAKAITDGHWCPTCSGNKKLSLEFCKEFAASHNCVCLSTAYKNARTKMLWKCSKGHHWSATYDQLKRRPNLCLKCKTSTVSAD